VNLFQSIFVALQLTRTQGGDSAHDSAADAQDEATRAGFDLFLLHHLHRHGHEQLQGEQCSFGLAEDQRRRPMAQLHLVECAFEGAEQAFRLPAMMPPKREPVSGSWLRLLRSSRDQSNHVHVTSFFGILEWSVLRESPDRVSRGGTGATEPGA